MLICSTIFLENEAIVISGSQKAVKIAKKVFRKVKMDTCMPEEDLEVRTTWPLVSGQVASSPRRSPRSSSHRGRLPR